MQAPLADHGISPAQLREKVEALEKRCESLASQDVLNFGYLTERLDAALKRIEEMARIVGMSARENQVDIRKQPIPDGGKLDHETSPPSSDGCDRCRGKSVGYYFPPPWAQDKP